MTAQNDRWLVITDLDGTMLNHHDYSMAAAAEAAHVCTRHGIPVILNTSKTYAETSAIRDALGLDAPFIVENGSAIYLPEGSFGHVTDARRDGLVELVTGLPVNAISDVLDSIDTGPENYIRFSRCSVEEAVELTGLTAEQAAVAIRREFSEPVIWSGDEARLQAFKQELGEAGLSTLQGGRFLHVIGDCDKGIASKELARLYGEQTRLAVLGDSPNDAAMLGIADQAMIVNSPSSSKLAAMVDADYLTEREAPEGWAEAISYLLERTDINEDA